MNNYPQFKIFTTLHYLPERIYCSVERANKRGFTK